MPRSALVRTLRTVVAVILGYAVFAIPAGLLFQFARRDPHAPQGAGFEIFAVIYGMVFAGLGGLLAAWMAPVGRVLHAGLVSLLIVGGAAISLLASGDGATWSQWSALLLMSPCAWLAAWVRASAAPSELPRRKYRSG